MTAPVRAEGPTGWPRLARVDAGLGEQPWRSLAPGREWARSLTEICGAVLGEHEPASASAVDALVDAVATIALAMRRSFPDNIFGDFELLTASLWRRARASSDPVSFLAQQAHRIAALQELFGRGTAIRFRYVHDFLYGFDWAKWVSRDPTARAGVGPFDPEFITYMERRGHELLALIAAGGDRKYPALPNGRLRNPFGFSREPEAEIALHRRLAVEGALPVEAWRTDAAPDWNRPYAAIRSEVARELGLVDAPVGADDPS